MCRDCNDLTMVCWAEFERQHEAETIAPDPRYIDADDAYLRCQDCGWCFPLEHTDRGEKCSECNGHLDCVRDSGECPRCGQRGGETVCPACRNAEREPQGQAVRLFEPAPTQLAGQLNF